MIEKNKAYGKNRTILYYPTITLPEGSWIRQAILYWDQISSIVPMRPDIYKEEAPIIPYTPDIEYLANKKVFRPIIPEYFFRLRNYIKKHEEFSDEIKKIIESEQFQRYLPKKDKRVFTARIHEDKISYSIFEWLKKKELAREELGIEKLAGRLEGGGQWLRFEICTGLLYMALLAKYLADIDVSHTIPATNFKAYESLIFDTADLYQGFACLDVRYRNVLPIPREDVALSDILEFKQKKKNREALLRFRIQLDQLHNSLSVAQNRNAVKQILAGFKEKIEEALAELTENLHDFRIETVSGCFKTMVNIKSMTLWGTVGVLTGKVSKIADVPIEWALPGLVIMGAIEVGDHLIHRINQQRATLRGSDFAYLYHAQQWGII